MRKSISFKSHTHTRARRHTQTKRLKSSGSSAVMSAEDTNGLESGGENDSTGGDHTFYNRPSSCHHSWHGERHISPVLSHC